MELKPETATALPPAFQGDGSFDVEVVGESHYQRALWSLSAPATTESRFEIVDVHLFLDDGNPHDEQAVAVLLLGQRIGHLSRGDARKLRKRVDRLALNGDRFIARAALTGGWKRGLFDRGHIGVRIDLTFPPLPRR